MYLGIEIGGTKLQLGVGAGDGSELVALERLDVDPDRGARGICDQIEKTGRGLVEKYNVERVAFGFGGPIDRTRGRVTTSHQIEGWDNFPLVEWCEEKLGCPTILGNDCDSAALAEARFGAGRERRVVFFITVGTGVGGGLVIDGNLHGTSRPASAEIGHLKPFLDSNDTLDSNHAGTTVEDMASGRGIETEARKRLTTSASHTNDPDKADLLRRCSDDSAQLTAKMIGEAAAAGNQLAGNVLARACRALGWGVAQVMAIAAPEVIVIGGGVSLMGEELFFEPLRKEVASRVFRPLVEKYTIVPASLGELVVVHGALAVASDN